MSAVRSQARDAAAKICAELRSRGADFLGEVDAEDIITDALLSFAPQTSPSDEVRGLIEAADYLDRLEGQLIGMDADMRLPDDPLSPSVIADRIRKAVLSTPPSSPVSGEGEPGDDSDQFAHDVEAAMHDAVEEMEAAEAGMITAIAARFYLARHGLKLVRHRVPIREGLENLARFMAEPDAPSRPPEPAASGEHWYLGSMNDGLFIIDRRPSPAGTDNPPHNEYGPTLVLNVTDLPQEKAQAVVDAHNATLTRPPEGNARAMREAIKAALEWLAICSDLEQSASNAQAILAEALALPVDDEAKRIRAKVIEEAGTKIDTLVAKFRLEASESEKRPGGIVAGITYNATLAQVAVLEIAARVVRALAQPEQGGAT